MRSRILRSWLAVMAVAMLAGACAREQEPAPATDDAMQDMPGMHDMAGMPVDTAMMRRHAAEAQALAGRLRTHVREMRALPREQWHERMGEHAGSVSAMMTLMTRQMREMDMGMGMDDEHMGRMMGMTGAEHRRMLDEMQALRSEAEELQTASAALVRERMPAHLDRVERMIEMLERSAAHMAGAADPVHDQH